MYFTRSTLTTMTSSKYFYCTFTISTDPSNSIFTSYACSTSSTPNSLLLA